MLWISCDMRGIDSCCKCKFLISKRTDSPIKAHWDSVLKSGWRTQYLKTTALFLPAESCLTLNVAKIDENFLCAVCQPLSRQTFLSLVYYFLPQNCFRYLVVVVLTMKRRAREMQLSSRFIHVITQTNKRKQHCRRCNVVATGNYFAWLQISSNLPIISSKGQQSLE